MAGAILERSVLVDGIRVFFRELPGEGTPTVFVHGNPTSSRDWLPFMDAMRGPAIAFDLPGFGRSERPDPYISADQGRALAERLERAELIVAEGAGHWPWLDRPELVDRVAAFLEPIV